MKFLAVDPGTHVTGWAIFVGDSDKARLLDAGAVRSTGSEGLVGRVLDMGLGTQKALEGHEVSSAAYEYPRVVRHGGGARVDPDDILALVLVIGVIMATVRTTRSLPQLVRPSEWKGQVPKDVMNRRVLGCLFPDERAICAKCKNDHNMLDAVGLGLWCLYRLPGR